MVGAHGGSIGVAEAAGGGAVFTVLLPAGSPEAAPQPETDSAPREAVHRQVLVIDDEPDITGFLVEVLEAAGHSVDVAASGPEALELLRAQDYAAIDRESVV